MRIKIDVMISHVGTVLIAILVNIAIGEVKGIKEHAFIRNVSTLFSASANITTINAAM
jgi:hypothetical protein